MNSAYELEYKELLKRTIVLGQREIIRGDACVAIFGESISFNCRSFNGVTGVFPMLTSKEMYFKNVKHELKWILSGDTNLEYLHKNHVSIWDNWDIGNGSIGNSYGKVIRNFIGIDQLEYIDKILREDSNSRQAVISLWNPLAIASGNIKPCYPLFQFVEIGGELNIIVHQRSSDLFVGLPYDMSFFVLLLMLISKHYSKKAGIVKINIGNAHVYSNHIDGVMEYINNPMHPLPTVRIETSGFDFDADKIKIHNYVREKFIKVQVKI